MFYSLKIKKKPSNTCICFDFWFLHCRCGRGHHHALRHGVVWHHWHHGFGHHVHHGLSHHGSLISQHDWYNHHGAHWLLCTPDRNHQHAHIAHTVIYIWKSHGACCNHRNKFINFEGTIKLKPNSRCNENSFRW